MSTKEPYLSTKEPYMSTKEPQISTKEPYMSMNHGWSGEGLKLEVETSYTERLYSVSSDVSRFEWESLAII